MVLFWFSIPALGCHFVLCEFGLHAVPNLSGNNAALLPVTDGASAVCCMPCTAVAGQHAVAMPAPPVSASPVQSGPVSSRMRQAMRSIGMMPAWHRAPCGVTAVSQGPVSSCAWPDCGLMSGPSRVSSQHRAVPNQRCGRSTAPFMISGERAIKFVKIMSLCQVASSPECKRLLSQQNATQYLPLLDQEQQAGRRVSSANCPTHHQLTFRASATPRYLTDTLIAGSMKS
jgi:hypothetical protein